MGQKEAMNAWLILAPAAALLACLIVWQVWQAVFPPADVRFMRAWFQMEAHRGNVAEVRAPTTSELHASITVHDTTPHPDTSHHKEKHGDHHP